MIEKYLYSDYSIDFKEKYSSQNESYYLVFNDKRELYLTEENRIPLVKEEFLTDFNIIVFMKINL